MKYVNKVEYEKKQANKELHDGTIHK